jgi:hypothetical protein
MQYVLLIHQGTTPLPGTPEWDALPDEVQRGVYADYAAVNAMQQMTGGLPLGLPGDATTVVVEDGETRRISGTMTAPHDTVGGYGIVEADDLDGAVAVAERIPAARLEIRPATTYW